MQDLSCRAQREEGSACKTYRAGLSAQGSACKTYRAGLSVKGREGGEVGEVGGPTFPSKT